MKNFSGQKTTWAEIVLNNVLLLLLLCYIVVGGGGGVVVVAKRKGLFKKENYLFIFLEKCIRVLTICP